jgi:hypothetical protein
MTGPAPVFRGENSAQPGPRVRQSGPTTATIIVPPAGREARIASVANFLRNCAPGRKLRVEIGPYSPKRSNNLNSYYWGVVVKMISDATGYESDEVHDILAMKFLPPRIVEIGGEAHAVRTRTSKLSTVDFQQFCEDCKRWAASELSLYIPDPNEEAK